MSVTIHQQALPIPPYDNELTALEDTQHRPIPESFGELISLRKFEPSFDEKITEDKSLTVQKLSISWEGREIPAITLSREEPLNEKALRPGILFCHGGGRVMGNVYVGLRSLIDIVKTADAIVLSVDYRLAPDFHGIAAIEDCYAGLVWMSQNLPHFRVDAGRFMIAGASAGGGIAAGTALLSRDRNGPTLCAQLLICPMLDDRCATLSCRQFENGRGFYTQWGRYAWKCVLGDEAGAENANHYVAAARATDLSNLPLAYIEVGSGEPFRDEDIAYATKLWECGVQAHLHVWGGGPHGFDLFYDCQLGDQANETRNRWLRDFLTTRK